MILLIDFINAFALKDYRSDRMLICPDSRMHRLHVNEKQMLDCSPYSHRELNWHRYSSASRFVIWSVSQLSNQWIAASYTEYKQT